MTLIAKTVSVLEDFAASTYLLILENMVFLQFKFNGDKDKSRSGSWKGKNILMCFGSLLLFEKFCFQPFSGRGLK